MTTPPGPKRKVLLIGWDSADWKVINPLLDAGKMPHLERLVNGGVIGNLATLYPILSPMLWTSIGTGKRPFKHGIHGFSEPDPHSGGVRPISNLSRKTKAIWNILSQEGKKCIVVGWWPSHPAEPLPDGVMVSNHYQRAPSNDPDKPWPMAPGTVHPARLSESLAELRIHPGELGAEHILPFVPKAAQVDQKTDRLLDGLAKTLADCTTIQAAATQLMSTEPWDFMAVYFDAIDHFGHGFMRYHPPRQKWVKEKDFELYSGVMEAAYRYHDMMLGVLMAIAGPDTTILLMSDHGFHPDNQRPSSIPLEPAGPAVEHRHYGIFALKGPGVKQDERISGATVLDITPTLLSLFGLPTGRDMDGKPLVNVFSEPQAITFIPSWDAVAGRDGTHPPGTQLEAADAKEALKQLEALGYIQPLPEDAQRAVEDTQNELDYNLACSYMDAGRYAESATILARLWEARQEEHRYGGQLLASQLAMGRLVPARATLERLRANKVKYAKEAAATLKAKRAELKDKKEEDLTQAQKLELHRLAVKSVSAPGAMRMMEAKLLVAEGRHAEAIEALKELDKVARKDLGYQLQLANCYLTLKQWDEAERALKKAIAVDADSAEAFLGFARLGLGAGRPFEAAADALTSVGLRYHNPTAHFFLGVALHRIGRVQHAVEAMKVCITQNPAFVPAHRRLAMIYERRLKRPRLAALHRQKADALVEAMRKRAQKSRDKDVQAAPEPVSSEPERSAEPPIRSGTPTAAAQTVALDEPREDAPFVTVVSGLPRSGTSLMMQMLVAGGLPALHDGYRLADADNPRGYYEFAPAKALRSDASWMPQAKGRVVKLVAQLLPFLPEGPRLTYRIVWMERDVTEVLASQKTMLERSGRAGAVLSGDRLESIYRLQLEQVSALIDSRKLAVLRIPHREVIRNPGAAAKRVAGFLGLPLDTVAMAGVVDPKLHRQKRL